MSGSVGYLWVIGGRGPGWLDVDAAMGTESLNSLEVAVEFFCESRPPLPLLVSFR